MAGNKENLSSYPTGVDLEHVWYQNDGLTLHAVSTGKGPLLVLLHGFPEFWYCWRHQLAPLAQHYRVVAADLRGFNSSESPGSDDAYAMPRVARDVLALIRALNEQQAIIIAHDWGGYVAWHAALLGPQVIQGLITLSVPNPNAMGQALLRNADQRAASAYVKTLANKHAHTSLNLGQMLEHLPLDAHDRRLYLQAYARSGLEGPLGYYRMSTASTDRLQLDLPAPIRCPVLAIHGSDDPYVTPDSYIKNEGMTAGDYRFELINEAGHFLPREQAASVNPMILDQLRSWQF
ncbi:MAG: alpha/beta hydrolase [Xanthomonadales bacterium]|nr:alpha/beta hydrolase [Xanthomonadales bacterium]